MNIENPLPVVGGCFSIRTLLRKIYMQHILQEYIINAMATKICPEYWFLEINVWVNITQLQDLELWLKE